MSDPDAAILADAGLKDARRRLVAIRLLFGDVRGETYIDLAINNIDAAIAVVGKDGNNGTENDD